MPVITGTIYKTILQEKFSCFLVKTGTGLINTSVLLVFTGKQSFIALEFVITTFCKYKLVLQFVNTISCNFHSIDTRSPVCDEKEWKEAGAQS